VYYTPSWSAKSRPPGWLRLGWPPGGVEFSQVILVVGGGQVAGNITSPQGFYQVRYAGEGVHAIYTVDQSVLPNEAPPIPVDAPSGRIPTSLRPRIYAPRST